MVMVGHHRVGAYFQGKNFGKFLQAINDPLPTVLIVFARKFILTTEEGSVDATGRAVIIKCAGGVYEIFSSGCHVVLLQWTAVQSNEPIANIDRTIAWSNLMIKFMGNL